MIMAILEVGYMTGAFVRQKTPTGRLAMQLIQRIPLSMVNGRPIVHETFVAEDPDPVGFCVTTFTNQRERDLHIFGVDPPLHRRGLGAEFLALLLAEPLKDCTAITCATAPHNTAMIKLLERNGFKRKREIEQVINWERLQVRPGAAAKPQRTLLGPAPPAGTPQDAKSGTPAVNVPLSMPAESGRLFQVPALTEPMQALVGFYAEPEQWREPETFGEHAGMPARAAASPPRATGRTMPPRAIGERPDAPPPERPVRGLGRLDEKGLGPVIQPTGLAGRHIEVRRRVYGRVLVSGLINFLMTFWSTKLLPAPPTPKEDPLFVVEPRELGSARTRARAYRVEALIPTEPLTPRLTLAEARDRLGAGDKDEPARPVAPVAPPIPQASLARYLEDPPAAKGPPPKIDVPAVRLAPKFGRRMLARLLSRNG